MAARWGRSTFIYSGELVEFALGSVSFLLSSDGVQSEVPALSLEGAGIFFRSFSASLHFCLFSKVLNFVFEAGNLQVLITAEAEALAEVNAHGFCVIRVPVSLFIVPCFALRSFDLRLSSTESVLVARFPHDSRKPVTNPAIEAYTNPA
jgi:hypothetical protein